MSTDITKQWDEISKAAAGSMQELGDINSKVIEKLTEQQMAILNASLEASQKEIDLAASEKNIKDPQALIAAQADLIAEYNSKIMEIVQSTGDILKDCNREITTWAEKGINTASKKPAAKKKVTKKKIAKKKTKKKAAKKK